MDISDFISSLPVFIGNAVETNQWIGYGAILLAMFLENLIPPIPSELIMPLGGFYVSQGQLDFLPVVLAGLIGTVIGALPWYGIGRLAWDCVIGQGLTFDRYFGDVLSSAWIVHRHWVGFGSWDGLEFVFRGV